MPYIMQLCVDGGCRYNGYPNAFGAAACVLNPKWGKQKTWTRRLSNDSWTSPSSQRAELTAVILALETAWNKYQSLDGDPHIHVTIYVDSKYAFGCMREWRNKWENNDFTNAAGNEVVNRDLIQQAWDLDDKVSQEGWVHFQWIPRAENQDADDAVNRELDDMEGIGMDEDDYSSGYSSEGYES